MSIKSSINWRFRCGYWFYVISSFLTHFTNIFWAESQKIQHVNQIYRLFDNFACRWWPAERLKLRKYFRNDNKTTHKTLCIMIFKPFSPKKYLFIMTLTVSIEKFEKVNLFRPNTPQRQTQRFVSHSPYCPVHRLNGPRAYIRTPLYMSLESADTHDSYVQRKKIESW